jgi:hypothetical protein
MVVKMAKDKDLVKESMTKLVSVFPNDVYIVHNKYIIAGDKSEENTVGYYFCIFQNDVFMEWKKLYPDNPVIYIKSLRESKISREVEFITDTSLIQSLEKKIETYVNETVNVDKSWERFEFKDDMLEKIFTNNESVNLFSDKREIIISKTIFPLITAKTINNVYYTFGDIDSRGLNTLYIQYDHEYFQLNMKYFYLPL